MNLWLSTLKARFAELDVLFRAREFRERVMLGCMAAAAIFFALDTAIIQPLDAERSRVALGTERANADLNEIRSEIESLTHVQITPEERRAKAEIQQLERQLAEIESQLGFEIAELIPPQAIVSVLEELLAADRSLKLIKLESQPPERIGQGHESSSVATGLGLYRHGLRIEIEGNFGATVSYLRRLEDSRWNLLWDRLEYQVQEFPSAKVTIELHTLSEREEWIGV